VAAATGTHPGAVRRLLRALVTVGLVEQAGDAFGLTPLGELLRADDPLSVHHSVALTLGPEAWRAWGELAACVRTGDTAARLLDGRDDPFADLGGPAEQATFDRAMAEGTRRIGEAVVAAYDMAGIRHVVDVGGGYGALLVPVLTAVPAAVGTVVDLPRCAAGASRLLADAGLADRAGFVAGDLFRDPLPAGADAYVVKSVVHDWDDERALAILRRCRAAMAASSRLLVVEVVVPDRLGTSPEHRRMAAADLTMLVATGGRERTESEHRDLIVAAGFRVTRIVPTAARLSVIEARRI
jgi:orsellinic acid C2-O-methyltransferase